MTSMDLNADMGEGSGTDLDLLDIVSSASIACGGHAGDDATMRQTLRAARARSVTCGAHPGFADRENFGRKRLNLTKQQLQTQIGEQLTRIHAIAQSEEVSLKYVKLHGALANMTAEDEELARTAFAVVRDLDPGLAILALDNSAQVIAAEALGLTVIREAYADRAYDSDGLLVSRTLPGAVLTDPAKLVAQCLGLARGKITTLDGQVIASASGSICLHGDTAGAVELARQARSALTNAGFSIQAPY